MPIYEYACSGCGHRFELLLFGAERPVCPKCSGVDLQKQLSVFAVSAPGSRAGGESLDLGGGPGPCGTCGDPRGPGSCSLD